MNLLRKIDFMKSLEDIDSIYKTIIGLLPKDQKIAYCENLIDRAQSNLIRNKRHINEDLQDELYTLILAARTVLNKLNI